MARRGAIIVLDKDIAKAKRGNFSSNKTSVAMISEALESLLKKD